MEIRWRKNFDTFTCSSAKKSRKKEQAKYQKKKEKKKENAQGTCHRSLASQSSIVAWCVLHIA